MATPFYSKLPDGNFKLERVLASTRDESSDTSQKDMGRDSCLDFQSHYISRKTFKSPKYSLA